MKRGIDGDGGEMVQPLRALVPRRPGFGPYTHMVAQSSVTPGMYMVRVHTHTQRQTFIYIKGGMVQYLKALAAPAENSRVWFLAPT